MSYSCIFFHTCQEGIYNARQKGTAKLVLIFGINKLIVQSYKLTTIPKIEFRNPWYWSSKTTFTALANSISSLPAGRYRSFFPSRHHMTTKAFRVGNRLINGSYKEYAQHFLHQSQINQPYYIQSLLD